MTERNLRKQDTAPLQDGADIGLHVGNEKLKPAWIVEWERTHPTEADVTPPVIPERVLSEGERVSMTVLPRGGKLVGFRKEYNPSDEYRATDRMAA